MGRALYSIEETLALWPGARFVEKKQRNSARKRSVVRAM
jgi:hypothetical protein